MDALIRDITGADRGFNVGADIQTRTADGYPLIDIYREFTDALNEWNQKRDVFSALFTSVTTDSFFQLAKNPEQGEDFELQSEFGVPKSMRRNVDYFRMGLPLDFYDAATRFTQAFLRDASREQVELQFSNALEADNRLVFRKTMQALTTKVTSGNRDVNENGVEIFDLWDGSAGETPPAFAGKTFAAGHNHYLVSGAATLDSGDIEALISTIQEHGFGLRNTGERLIVLVHPDQADAIATWRRGVENANSAIAKYDFIPAQGAPAYLTDETIVGDRPPATYNSLAIEGSYGDAWIVKDYQVPTGYVIATATSGSGSTRNPLAIREHVNSEYRGLRLITVDNHPLRNSYFQRGIGVGVRNRSAAAVLEIKASGSYVDPTWP